MITSCIKYFLLLVASLLFFSCTTSAKKELLIKSIDSLQTALLIKQSELNKIDTIQLNKALTKVQNYNEFINQNINDTLTKNEAENLDLFFVSGKNLISFSENRKTLLVRINLTNSQLIKLKKDIEAGNFNLQEIETLHNDEKIQVITITSSVSVQLQNYISNLQSLKNTLLTIETLIKNRNAGNLPSITQNTSEF